ncbi:MAG: VWA domain-containing protein [Candidatus Aminicenantes bacterium]|nr:VWA domain-containing protein [Candidatus Aminicenantes bacterium]
MKSKFLVICPFLVLFFCGILFLSHSFAFPYNKQAEKAKTETERSAQNIIFILDASGSMWGQVEGKAKIAIAKEVLTDLIQHLPDDVHVGLVAYGHRRKGDCSDVEELIPLSLIQKAKLVETVQSLNPKGKTPITLSVQKTAEKLKEMEEKTTIILVSDGKETCEGDPCILVRELKAAGIKFVMHVIGFDVTEEERLQLECMAEAGGGLYYTAKTAVDFQMAIKEVVVREEPKEVGILTVKVIKNAKPIEAKIFYHRAGESESFFNELTDPTMGIARLEMAPGDYTIRVVDIHTEEEPSLIVEGLTVPLGGQVEKTVEFSSGTLKILSQTNGEPCFCSVKIMNPEGKVVSDFWTQHGERVVELLEGTYDVRLALASIPGGDPVIELKDVQIVADRTVERTANFAIGFLKVTTTLNGKPYNTMAHLYQTDGQKITNFATEGSRTVSLNPGVYRLKVVNDKDESQIKDFEGIQIEGGKTVSFDVAFLLSKKESEKVTEMKPEAVRKEESAPVEEAAASTSTDKSGREAGRAASERVKESEILWNEIPIYPGAEVLNINVNDPLRNAELKARAALNDIVEFYKKAMTERDWQVGTATVQGSKAYVMLMKGASRIVISAQKKNETSHFDISWVKK